MAEDLLRTNHDGKVLRACVQADSREVKKWRQKQRWTNCSRMAPARSRTRNASSASRRVGLYAWMQDGTLPYSQVGDRRYLPRRALRKLIADGLIGVKEIADAK